MIEGLIPRKFYSLQVGKQVFQVDRRYQNLKVIGSGSYGVVCSADDIVANRRVAIKKIGNLFQDIVDAKRVLREIKMLQCLGCHENIISLYDVIPMPYGKEDFTDIYIVTQLYECDLDRIISSNQVLTECHIQFFLFQLLKALKFLHSAHVLHRDLKPSNILVNSNCDLAICDFGLARSLDHDSMMMTEYVVTRWYRAPELICENSSYDSKVDIWSLGCIFAELLGRQPLLQGKNPIDQLGLIIKLLGPQTGESLHFIQKQSARDVVSKLNFGTPISFRERFPDASDNAIDLLSRMLVFDASKRISVDEALCHPFLISLTRSNPHFKITTPFDFTFEKYGDLVPLEVLRVNFLRSAMCFPTGTNIHSLHLPFNQAAAEEIKEKLNCLNSCIIMKNKWMTREINRILPDGYECKQCGIVKLFATYANGMTNLNENEWKDPEIIGVAALIQHEEYFSTYIRLYEIDSTLSTILFECQLPTNCNYQLLTSYFHSFETQNLEIGILFCREKHARQFYKHVTHCLSKLSKFISSSNSLHNQIDDSTKAVHVRRRSGFFSFLGFSKDVQTSNDPSLKESIESQSIQQVTSLPPSTSIQTHSIHENQHLPPFIPPPVPPIRHTYPNTSKPSSFDSSTEVKHKTLDLSTKEPPPLPTSQLPPLPRKLPPIPPIPPHFTSEIANQEHVNHPLQKNMAHSNPPPIPSSATLPPPIPPTSKPPPLPPINTKFMLNSISIPNKDVKSKQPSLPANIALHQDNKTNELHKAPKSLLKEIEGFNKLQLNHIPTDNPLETETTRPNTMLNRRQALFEDSSSSEDSSDFSE